METQYILIVTEDNEVEFTRDEELQISSTSEELTNTIEKTFHTEFQDALFYARYLINLAKQAMESEYYDIGFLQQDLSEYNKAYREATITTEGALNAD